MQSGSPWKMCWSIFACFFINRAHVTSHFGKKKKSVCHRNGCLDLGKKGVFPLNRCWPCSDHTVVLCVQVHKDKRVRSGHTAEIKQQSLLTARLRPHSLCASGGIPVAKAACSPCIIKGLAKLTRQF